MGRLSVAALGSLSALLVAAPAAVAGPNQGETSKVLTADNPLVQCAAPVPTGKVEVRKGRTIQVSSALPIDYVTLKSGKGAKIVSASFSLFSGSVTLSKDVSNYVVWVCEDGGGGDPIPI